MIHSLRSAVLVGIGLVLVACGGGGGGGGSSNATSISVSPTSLSFKAATGDTRKSANVTAIFKGDGVVAGFPPGVEVPSWLDLVATGSSSNHATFTVNVRPVGFVPGVYSTTLRFVTGRVDSDGNASDIKYNDVPVTMTVAELRLSPEALTLEAPHGTNTNLTGTLTLQIANGQAWKVADTQPWLTVAPSGVGPGLIDYTINPSGLALGVHTATVTVTGPEQLTDTTTITLTLYPPRLTANPVAPSFMVATDNASATLEQTLHVADELDGNVPASAIVWSIQSISAAWLQMTPASGSSAPGVDATLSLVEAQLATMANGTYTANVVLAYTDAGNQARTLTVPVTLNLNSPLQSISVTPGTAQRVAGVAPVQFTATGTYATGYSADVTSQVGWASSSAAVHVGNGGALVKGKGAPIAPGAAIITAAMPGTSVSDTATFTVTTPLGYAYLSGIYSSGIHQYLFGDDGELHPIYDRESVATGAAVGTTRISPSGDYAYAVSGLGIHQFTVAAGGYLEPMSSAVVSGSANTGLIAVDPSGQYLYAAAYESALSQYKIRHYSIGNDGSLSLISASTPGVASAWAMEVLPTGGYLYVTDSTEITSYSIGVDGALSRLGTTSPAGQDLALDPSGGAAYTVTQYDVFQYTVGADGALTPMSPASVPVGGNSIGSHVVVDATGGHAYAIDSYQGKVRHYTIGADLKLTASGTDASGVPYTPIDVAIEPSGKYLYVTGNTNLLAKFTLDENGNIVGEPTYMGTAAYPRGFAVRAGQ